MEAFLNIKVMNGVQNETNNKKFISMISSDTTFP
jgi:hypothetical protein